MLVRCWQNQTFYDLVGEHSSSFIINFEQVMQPFLVCNIYFTFFLSVVDCNFYKSTIQSICALLLCHVLLRSSRQEVFYRLSTLLKKRLCYSCFPVNFAKFLQTPFITEQLRWLLMAFQSESKLYSFRICSWKQAQYLKFK